MKKIISILLLSLASTASFADCRVVMFANDNELTNMFEERNTNLDDEEYNHLCTQLKKNRAGIYFDYVTQVSPHQTTTYVSLRLFDITDDNENGKGRSLITFDKTSLIAYSDDKDRDDDQALYELSMEAMSSLAQDQEMLDIMFSQLNKLRPVKKDKNYW